MADAGKPPSAELRDFLAQEQAKAQVRSEMNKEHTQGGARQRRGPTAGRAASTIPPLSSPPPSPQIQQTVATLTSICWDKCTGSPGRSLGSREASCLRDCAQRFLDTTRFIVERFQHKARQGGEGGMGGLE